ncbi:MAG: fold metallo-hydrolase [Acidimicrobiia bacterium]|nr:fold metallo-hydrolase [Acidimicrobiia bacterium]
MARLNLRHPANAGGNWYVDSRCIDCGTCRELAPEIFAEDRTQSVVRQQPSPAAETGAWLAAQACPTQSIGTVDHQRRPGRLFPREIEAGSAVFDLGYCSPDSFGATSWFVARPSGNVMIDSPRFTPALVGPLSEHGGVDHIALTHRDDVADAKRWAAEFGARVWISEADRAAAPFATDLLGTDDTAITTDLLSIAVPGHTRGSVAFLLDNRYLFTGDSLAWSHERNDLTAFRDACWYSWPEQTESLARLARQHEFNWVLPGHGARAEAPAGEMRTRLLALLDRMRAPR